MKVLVVNCGSSSLKYQLLDMNDESVLAIGLAERIGIKGSKIKHEPCGKDSVVFEEPMEDHKVALEIIVKALVDEKHGCIASMDEIDAVGHRVVHGGEKFTKSAVVTDEVIKGLNEVAELAPLHNPPNIMGIEACREIMPNTPMVVVFDTAFHQTMPEESYIYGIPYELYEKHAIRRYGFHGISHDFVSNRASEILGKDLKDMKMVTCHLGNGSSISAIQDGKCLDTSMGFTPLAGLIMGTRCGDLDPAVVTYIMNKEDLSAKEVNDLLNKESGVLGISGVSSDFRDVENAANDGNERAKLALDIFNNRAKKYIGGYASLMGGIDTVVFTAGLGENAAETRRDICKGLEFLGIEIDQEVNKVRGKETIISTDDSKVKVIIIPTNEELVIARDTKDLVK